MKESFLLYKSFYDPIKELSIEDKGHLLDAIFKYQIDGIEPVNTSSIYMPFMFFKNQFRLDDIKYQKIVDRNKINGSKGGRPKNPKEPKKPSGLSGNPKNPSKPKKPDNEKDNDNDNEKENDLKNIPSFEIFKTYALEQEPLLNIQALKLKYESWKVNDWKDGNDKPIKNWKSKLLNTIQYLQKDRPGQKKKVQL